MWWFGRPRAAQASFGFDYRKATVHKYFDIKMLVPDDDIYLCEIAPTGEYDPYVTRPFIEILRPQHTVLDLGANVGCFSLLAATRTRRVLAVELSAANCKMIIANARLNNLHNIEVYPVAAAERFGVMGFRTGKVTSNTTIVEIAGADPLDDLDLVLAAPLDALVGERHIDVAKIDVDGSEFVALAPATRLRAMRPLVFTEYCPQLLEKISRASGESYLDLFFDNQYQGTILHRDLHREEVGHDKLRIRQRWEEYMARGITHLDLQLTPPQ